MPSESLISCKLLGCPACNLLYRQRGPGLQSRPIRVTIRSAASGAGVSGGRARSRASRSCGRGFIVLTRRRSCLSHCRTPAGPLGPRAGRPAASRRARAPLFVRIAAAILAREHQGLRPLVPKPQSTPPCGGLCPLARARASIGVFPPPPILAGRQAVMAEPCPPAVMVGAMRRRRAYSSAWGACGVVGMPEQ
jgi:hypothetical protein